jgi:hypothetical protein
LTNVRELDETLNELSDLNMVSFFRDEFQSWNEGGSRLVAGNGDYLGVARFAARRGFFVPHRASVGSVPPLSRKGSELLGMDARQNRGRWAMLVDTLKEMGV